MWGVRTEQVCFFPSYGHCQPVRTFGQRQKWLLLMSEGNLIFLEDLAGPPIAGGGRAWSPSAMGLAL